MRILVVLALLTIIPIFGSTLQAQDASRRDLRSVSVKLDGSAKEIKARLVHLDENSVTLLVNGEKIVLPTDRVERIRARRRDSIVNGAMIGALAGGLLCARNCGQGLDSAGQLPLAVAFTAGVWGAAGAGIDALVHGEDILYPPSPRSGP